MSRVERYAFAIAILLVMLISWLTSTHV